MWEDERPWTLEMETQFSEWIASDHVHEYMFVNPGSPYFGIKVDCADATYALRAIFSYENKLPFAIINPSGSRGKDPTLHNRLDKWDRFPEGLPRLIGMINEITISVGTDNLAYLDSYPIALKSIRPGSVFVSKIQLDSDTSIKHAFNIKNINPVGTLDVIYSSESIQATNGPMQRRKDKVMDVLPTDPYGYRKFRWPEYLGKKIKDLPAEAEASFEQFELAKLLGLDEFSKLLKKTIGTVEESDEQMLLRSLNAICLEAQARIEVVELAQKRVIELGGACMEYRDYDTYSTPARDASLKEAFFSLQRNYHQINERGGLEVIDEELVEHVERIILEAPNNDDGLLKRCPITYADNTSIDLAELWKRVYFQKMSTHPNDSIAARWGEPGERTSCKAWY